MKMINTSDLTYKFQIEEYELTVEAAPGAVVEVPDEYATRARFLDGHAPGLKPYVEAPAVVEVEVPAIEETEEAVEEGSEPSLKARGRKGKA